MFTPRCVASIYILYMIFLLSAATHYIHYTSKLTFVCLYFMPSDTVYPIPI